MKNVDYGYADTYQHSLDLWAKFDNIGFYQGTVVTNSMTEEETDEINDVSRKLTGYLEPNVVKFIKGEWNPADDTDWNNWCTVLNKYGLEKVITITQKYADLYPLELPEE